MSAENPVNAGTLAALQLLNANMQLFCTDAGKHTLISKPLGADTPDVAGLCGCSACCLGLVCVWSLGLECGEFGKLPSAPIG